MATLFTTQCSSCDYEHDFYLSTAGMRLIGGVYEYECPNTNRRSRVSASFRLGKVVNGRPDDAVIATVVPPDPSARDGSDEASWPRTG